MKPDYNQGRGPTDAFLLAPPPFDFSGVRNFVFPLPANLYRLEQFVDQYLNRDLPPNIARFRPAAPFVLLTNVNYGRAAADAVNLGWLAQNELVFLVPLVHYREDKDGWKFVEMAVISPFVYLNEAWSISAGREVYGWPKYLAEMTPRVDPWKLKDSSLSSPLVVKVRTLPRLFAGQDLEKRVLLEFKHRPFRFGDPPRVQEMAVDLKVYCRQLVQFLTSFLLRPPARPDYEFTSIPSFFELLGQQASKMAERSIGFSNINLKQVPSIEDPTKISYQDINISRMNLAEIDGFRLLDLSSTLAGDFSGGFEIHIHQYRSHPIVDSLGLVVSRQERFKPSGSESLAQIDILRPIAPFALDVDLRYGKGNILCWRTAMSQWFVPSHKPDGRPIPISSRPRKEAERPRDHVCEPHSMNTTLGGAVRASVGAIDADATIRVLPLKARKERLESFCRQYLKNGVYDFKPWGSYVYLVATNYEMMSTKDNNTGLWLNHDVGFLIPVSVHRACNPAQCGCNPAHPSCNPAPLTFGFVAPFAFTDSETDAILLREVKGVPAAIASIQPGQDPWLGSMGDRERIFMDLKTSVLPSLNLRQEVKERTLLQITDGDILPYNTNTEWRQVALNWGRKIVADYDEKQSLRDNRSKDLRILEQHAVELLSGHQAFNHFALKQVRDAAHPDKACYQSLVRTRFALTSMTSLGEIEDRVHVRIYQYPSLPIVELLGLEVKYTQMPNSNLKGSPTNCGATIDHLQPIRPFQMRAKVHRETGRELAVRLPQDDRWKKVKSEDLGRHDDARLESPALDGALLLRTLEVRPQSIGHSRALAQEKPGFLEKVVDAKRAWLGKPPLHEPRSKDGTKSPSSEGSAPDRQALVALPPQLALESVLSGEWEHWGEPRWWFGEKSYREWLKKYREENRPNNSSVRPPNLDMPGKESASHDSPRFSPAWPKPPNCFRADTIYFAQHTNVAHLWLDDFQYLAKYFQDCGTLRKWEIFDEMWMYDSKHFKPRTVTFDGQRAREVCQEDGAPCPDDSIDSQHGEDTEPSDD